MIYADTYDQKKIIIINNLDVDIQLEPPMQKNTSAYYPAVIQAHNLGEVVVNIEKDWLIDTPISVQFSQKIKYPDGFMILSLSRNEPSPDLLEPFTPGFKCDLKNINMESQLSIMSLGKNSTLCNTFYLY